MTEQVQVRPGVWLTRGCEQLEIRPSRVEGWPWLGVCGRTLWHYRDNGRVDDRGVMDEDLIEFIRPLPGTESEPQQETTTDTLVQIEGQIDQEQPWDRLAVALQQQLTESLAERDRLQQQLETMTSERDLLAQRLMTKDSEKALQKQVGKQQIEINTLQDKLQDVTSDRDRLAGELANAQQLAADLRGEVDFVRTQKTAQEHQLRAAIARLQRELQQARIDLEAERQVPRSEIAISDAAFAGFTKGKAWAFREVCDWLRPFVGADAKDAAALLDAVPGLVKRLAQCEGVEI
jgi:hypothetical protein